MKDKIYSKEDVLLIYNKYKEHCYRKESPFLDNITLPFDKWFEIDNNIYKLNDIVYHKSVYSYHEALKVVGIREKELELEGDYSGGTHKECQRCWLPIDGVSKIYKG